MMDGSNGTKVSFSIHSASMRSFRTITVSARSSVYWTFRPLGVLEDLCRDFSTMLSSDERPERIIVVEAIEIDLPTVTAIPLGFIVNELVTNAAKYGKGLITVKLEPNTGKRYALSVSDNGPGLPEGYDPAACKGLGMRIIRSFVERIGGELKIGRGDNGQGTRFMVLFS